MRCLILFLTALVCASTGVYAQDGGGGRSPIFDLQQAGQLPIAFIPGGALELGPSVWDLAQDADGLIYAGATNGIMVYDGVRWTAMAPRMLVRSLAAAPDGRMYVGASGYFGYLEPDQRGALVFHSLMEHVPDSARSFNDVWSTVAHEGAIVFQTLSHMMRWDGEAMTIIPFERPEDRVFTLTSIQGQLLGATRRGVVEVVPGAPSSAWPSLTDAPEPGDGLVEIIDGGAGHIITVSLGGGMQRCTLAPPVSCTPWAAELSEAFSAVKPFAAQALHSGAVAVGFDGHGIALLHPDGTLLRWLKNADGLGSGEVMHLFEDRDGILWAGLFNGLAQVHVHTPLTVFDAPEGIESLVVDVAEHEGMLYASTQVGLRRFTQQGERARFEEVPGAN
ncbi:MAG: two-component regulator propeller domain-containing protein, partial [Bacteroidota bacterium]